MKMLIGVLSFALSFASIASSGETKTFTYDGTQNSIELVLKGEKTHTEYRSETRQTICYRTITTFRTICTGGYGPGRPGPGRPGPGRQCYQQPYYQQVSYPCTQVVQVPYEVRDYDVQANVLVDVTNLTGVATPGEKFVVTLLGDTVSFTAVGSKKFFLNLKKQDLRDRMAGSLKLIDGLFAVEMIEAAPILKSLQMTNITLKEKVLTFKIGPVTNAANIGFSLNVTQKRALASDIVLFDRDLDASEVVLNTEASGNSAAGVNVEKLGVTLNDGKYSLTAKAFYKAEGTLLNRAQFGDDLDASRTLIYKIR